MQKLVFSIIVLFSYSFISTAIAVEPTSLPPGKINPHALKAKGKSNPKAIVADNGAGKVLKSKKTRSIKGKGKSNPKAIVADNGAGKVLKSKKGRYDTKKGVIKYPRDDGGRTVK